MLQFRTKYLTKSIRPDDTTWQNQLAIIKQIIQEHQLDQVTLPLVLSDENARPIKKQLLAIYKTIYHKAWLEQRWFEH